jgi:ribosomal protein S18 acetylase RimI-like enzyme
MGFPDRYRLRPGVSRDRAVLLKFLTATYHELFPQQDNFAHLAKTVDQYFCAHSPLWWVEATKAENKTHYSSHISPIAGLWMGNAIDQVTGDRYCHIFMVYVHPDHRRQGIATGLIEQAQVWAQKRGDRQVGLQVFGHNQPAIELYERLGFRTQSLFLLKPLPSA